MFKSTQGKYAGRSKATVIDNRDPLKKGRIRVTHPLLGDTSWIEYLKVPGQFNTPSIGDVVFVECESGIYEYPVAWGNATKSEKGVSTVPDKFKRDIPTNRGWQTPNGHSLELDDGQANLNQNPVDNDYTTKDRGIRVTSTAGNKIHIIEDSDNGNTYILIQDVNGNLIKLDYNNNHLTINSIGTTQFDTGNDRDDSVGGNLKIDVVGNVTINCTDANINSSGNTNVTAGGNTVVNASEIQLNGTAGDILTTTTDPLVDLITGVPTVGVPTVKSG